MGFAVKWSLSCLIIVPLAMLLLAFGSWFGLVLIGMGVTAFGVVMVTDYRGLTSGMRGAHRTLGLKVSTSVYRILPRGVIAMGIVWIGFGLSRAF
jgi:hypothetical protein